MLRILYHHNHLYRDHKRAVNKIIHRNSRSNSSYENTKQLSISLTRLLLRSVLSGDGALHLTTDVQTEDRGMSAIGTLQSLRSGSHEKTNLYHALCCGCLFFRAPHVMVSYSKIRAEPFIQNVV